MADSLISVGIGIFKRLRDLGDGAHAEETVARTLAPLEQRTDVGALAASAIATTAALDLGPAETRQHTRIIAYKSGLASAGESITPHWSDDGVTWEILAPTAIGSSTIANANNTTSASRMMSQFMPPGRYVRFSYTNGATPQTALLLAITAIAGI